MANEAQLSVTLNVQKRDATTGVQQINFSYNATNIVTVAGSAGPYGGTVSAAVGGTFVPAFTGGTPGLALFTNQDTTRTVYVGTYDNSTGRFTPFLKLLPGMTLPAYLPEKFEEWSGVAPGTASLASDQLMLKSVGGAANVLVQIFPE